MHSYFVLLFNLAQTRVVYFSDAAFQSTELDNYNFYSMPRLHIEVHYSQETQFYSTRNMLSEYTHGNKVYNKYHKVCYLTGI